MKKINLFILSFLSVGLSCGEPTEVYEACGSECYDAPRETIGISHCKSGILVCSVDGDQECVGESTPTDEVCDGIDNDCDGLVDEGVWFPGNAICDAQCGVGLMKCIEGAFICQGVYQVPEPEICDNKDNDCDGLIDELEDLPVEFCYSGDNQELFSGGTCRPGVKLCQNGSLVCSGQILPSEEVCDGIDNDCNGIKDDGINFAHKERDILFIIDVSGSVGDIHLQRHVDGIIRFIDNFYDTDYTTYGLLIIGTLYAPYLLYDCLQTNEKDCKAEEMKNALLQRRMTSGGALEPSYDGLYVGIETNAWTVEDKTIIIFADEEAQSLRVSSIQMPNNQFNTMADMKTWITNRLIEKNIKLISWTHTPNMVSEYTFPPMTKNVYNIFDNQLSTYDILMENFPIECE